MKSPLIVGSNTLGENHKLRLTKLACVAVLSGLGFIVGGVTIAETIRIPVGQQAPELRDLPRPTRGMSQNEVLSQFGEPSSLSKRVGDPPISKWEYEHFTVYFESTTVIHSVLTHSPKFPEQLTQD